MNRVCRTGWLLPALWVAGAVVLVSADSRVRAQIGPEPSPTHFELAETVQLDRADAAVMAQLARANAYLADRQWDEAVETLRKVMEGSEGKLAGVTERRFVGLRDYVNLQMANLPAEALRLYRSRVDPLAEKWYKEGAAQRDGSLLGKVVEEAFASSWGDKALLTLGEMALESADYAMARWYWERIVPAHPPAGAPVTWPGFPDSRLDLAAIRARLVLASILEGDTERARGELAQFTRLHGDARGWLGGSEVNYAESLAGLLRESTTWPPTRSDPDWPTFAGSPLRNRAAEVMVDPRGVAWRIPLSDEWNSVGRPKPNVDEAAVGRPLPNGALEFGEGLPTPPRAVGKPFANDGGALSYHPILVGDLALVNNRREVVAVRLATGKPAWGAAGAVIYRAELEGAAAEPSDPSTTLGGPQYTMTAYGGRLYARMGCTLTDRPKESPLDLPAGYLVCLDLAAEGRLLWKIVAEEGWAFEGAPLADETSVYVAMRRSDVYPEAHVACFDAATGRRRWMRLVCGAEMPGASSYYRRTHNLLTLDRQTLYYNTNLGAVAAIAARDGRLLWVSLYPRARRGDLDRLAPHWQRQLNPCVVDRGTLLVAPADSPRIFALDAGTGQILWQTGPEVQDVLHLLGTTAEYLIAGGGKLYWIGLKEGEKGQVKHVWPVGHERSGFGRGVLAAGRVLWPTREKVLVFDQKTAQPVKAIDLVPHGVTGGNLLVGDGCLLIATATELIALTERNVQREGNPNEVTSNAPTR